jgi:hypothetical protein
LSWHRDDAFPRSGFKFLVVPLHLDLAAQWNEDPAGLRLAKGYFMAARVNRYEPERARTD